ncbi:hypothetical protein G9A89_009761 [Geosiphon pyriformis]|nr:hypothetical protein G9A89_009761 [Geosiphon pyriformis]
MKDSPYLVWSDSFKVYTDGLLRGAGFVDVVSDTAAYFLVLNMSVGIAVHGFLSSTIVELQAIALFLKNKDLIVNWIKIKSYFGIAGIVKANFAAEVAVQSSFFLLVNVQKHFLVADNTAVFSSAHYFVKNIFGLFVILIGKLVLAVV